MLISKKAIITFNQKFAEGNFENESSLNYALEYLKHDIAWTKQLAYLIRAILIDHVFEEGNKRTACALLLTCIDLNSYQIDEKKALNLIKQIILKNITEVNKIQWMIEDAITKR